MKVTPWEVKGKINYEKLIKEFGTKKVDDNILKKIENLVGELHYTLRRKIFFSHRDLDILLSEYEKGNKFVVYTGRGPSGKMHIGHLLPFYFTKWLQDKFDTEVYIQLTDDEKFLFKRNLTLEQTKKFAYDNILDIIAVGFNPKKTFIFLNTEYIKTLYPIALKVAKKTTFSTAKAIFGFSNESNIGQIFYTSLQSAPAFLPSIKAGKPVNVLIPCGVDQDAHFRLTRDLAQKLGFPKPALIHSILLPSLQGPETKMSTSEPMSAIFTTDTEREIKKKINSAFSGGRETIEAHRKYGGNPNADMPFQYLKLFFEPNDENLKKIEEEYKSGNLLSGELKQICIKKAIKFIKRHQKEREKAKKLIDKFIVRD